MTPSITMAPDATDATATTLYPLVRLTSRKFLLALATLLCASLLLCFGHIEALVWRDVVIATVGAYIAGNVTQRVMATRAPAS